MKVVRETLEGIVKNGLTGKLCWLVSTTMNSVTERRFWEFSKRTHVRLQMFDSWLYDENQPFLHLIALDRFAKMREKLDEGYFEALIRTWILDNPHGALLVLKPVPVWKQSSRKHWQRS